MREAGCKLQFGIFAFETDLLAVIAILETPRFLYLCYTRAFPGLIALGIVLWLAQRRASHAPAGAPVVSMS